MSATGPDHGSAGPLTILPALRAGRCDDGGFRLTRKFLDGLLAYAQRWPGPVRVWMAPAQGADSNLDHVEVRPGALPLHLGWLEPDPASLERVMRGSAVVLASLVDRHAHLAAAARRSGVSLVYVTEQSLRTRRQIIGAEAGGPLRRLYRLGWTTALERRYRAAVAAATGVQCNGTPTHEAYRAVNRNALLYFDTRVRDEMVVTPAALEARLDRLARGGPLQLFFTGRLVRIKGVEHLPLVAEALRRAAVPFDMHLCGGGDREPAVRRSIERLGLTRHVRLHGILDFATRLVPMVAAEADLFLCCHRQGDPACTYLETLACGVPLAGYANDAMRGIAAACGAGWTVPLDRPAALARVIASLSANRGAIAAAARAARTFALHHTFERTMDARVDHLRRCAGLGAGRRAA
jgi:hypothetical protein